MSKVEKLIPYCKNVFCSYCTGPLGDKILEILQAPLILSMWYGCTSQHCTDDNTVLILNNAQQALRFVNNIYSNFVSTSGR